MRKNLLLAGFAAAALLPSLAMAQETCEQRSANRTTGTVLGAIGGALVGNAVSHGGGKTGVQTPPEHVEAGAVLPQAHAVAEAGVGVEPRGADGVVVIPAEPGQLVSSGRSTPLRLVEDSG